jgi:hypothetical protein
MTELEIKTKLDTLSEYQAHRDLLEVDKRKLLDEVKIPAEVEAAVSAGMRRLNEADAAYILPYREAHDKHQQMLDAIVMPPEVREAINEYNQKRKNADDWLVQEQEVISKDLRSAKEDIRSSTESATKDVYAALAARKAEIEAEFAGKAEAVDKNIEKLTEEIKADVKVIGFTVAGAHLQAVWGKGKKSWIPQRLDKYTETHPDIKDCYTVGDPSVSIKRI